MTPQEGRAPGWGSVHSQPPYRADNPPGAPKISEASRSLRKGRIGKGEGEPLRCQKCWAKDAEQYECLCVLCGQCFKGHTHHA